MRALLSHLHNTYSTTCKNTVQDLAILRVSCQDSLRWRAQRTIVDIFRCGKAVADRLKPRFELRVVDSASKIVWSAEQQRLVFVQLNVRQESDVRTIFGDARANVGPRLRCTSP